MGEDSIIILANYNNSLEANIARGVLESHDIPCFLSNENYMNLIPIMNVAVKGIQLRIFEKDKETALAILNNQEYELPTDEIESKIETKQNITCPQCSSSNVRYGQSAYNKIPILTYIISFLFFIYPLNKKKFYHCFNCGYEFKK